VGVIDAIHAPIHPLVRDIPAVITKSRGLLSGKGDELANRPRDGAAFILGILYPTEKHADARQFRAA
jgi:hypothetical protein